MSLTQSTRKVYDIVQMGNPVLRVLSEPLSSTEILSNDTTILISNLISTMQQASGVGLAAPQVGISKRIFVAGCNRTGITPPLPPIAFINPVIDYSESFGVDKITLFEGCLSLPGIRALVPRYQSIKISFNEVTGKRRVVHATGYLSGLLQHEFDHLNGVLFIDKMDPTTLCVQSLCDKYFPNAGVRKGSWEYIE